MHICKVCMYSNTHNTHVDTDILTYARTYIYKHTYILTHMYFFTALMIHKESRYNYVKGANRLEIDALSAQSVSMKLSRCDRVTFHFGGMSNTQRIKYTEKSKIK